MTESVAGIFDLLWENLNDVLGSPASAALMRRCLRRAARRFPDVSSVVVLRDGFDYRCETPASWREGMDAIESLRAISDELALVLHELSGDVIVTRLKSLEPVRRHGLFSGEER